MVVFGVEERDAGEMRVDDGALGVEDLLRGNGALVVVDAVDGASRYLAAATYLQVAGPNVYVRRGESQEFALLGVLDLKVTRHFLDHVRQHATGRGADAERVGCSDDQTAERHAHKQRTSEM